MKWTKKDIVLINNPSQWYGHWYPSGLLCLSNYLELKGYKNSIIDSAVSKKNLDPSIREPKLIQKIKSLNPKIVCFSSTFREFDEVVRLNSILKKSNPKIFTIIGGAQPTYRYQDYINNGFDYVAIGEGEKTLFEFVEQIKNKTYDWQKINGLAWRKNGQIILNPPRQLMTEAEINSVPLPPYEKIDKRYFQITGGTIRGLPLKCALIYTSRGCPYSCSYCGCNLIFGKKLRYKSLENVEKEIKYLKTKFGIEAVWFVDDTFTVNRPHVEGIGKILKKYNIIWGCQTRVNTIDEELMKTMKQYGCVQLDFGVESGSQRILDQIIGKGITMKQVKVAFDLARTYKMRTLAFFIIGLPSETYADLKKSEKLAEEIKADAYVFSIATPIPGTGLYNMVKEEITPQEYNFLEFGGGILTNKLNKSKIKDLLKERERLQTKFNLITAKKGFLSFDNIHLFLKRDHKIERLIFVFNYFFQYFKNKIKSQKVKK